MQTQHKPADFEHYLLLTLALESCIANQDLEGAQAVMAERGHMLGSIKPTPDQLREIRGIETRTLESLAAAKQQITREMRDLQVASKAAVRYQR